jgi:hypothetical protein
MRGIKLAVAALVLVAAGLVAGVSARGAAAASSTTCTSFLAPGTYQKVVVPAGASCFSDGGVTIRGGLYVQPGATFVLGSGEAPGDNGTITGGVHATSPANLQIHFMTINGGVESRGGSGPVGGPFGITWTTIEDSHVNGGVSITGYDGFWMGFIRNDVNGSVTLSDNRLADPDGNEYVTNSIHGSLSCYGNTPPPQTGDSGGGLNSVTGAKKGQCASV